MLNQAKIFVVEDEPLIAMELAQMIIEAGGVVAASAKSQQEAIELARSADIQAALLDVRLPGGKSFDVAVLLAGRGIPFLFCTADVDDPGQFLDWPGVPVIAKPYKPDVLIEQLGKLLKP